MRSSLLFAVSLLISACAGMEPITPPVPTTPHVVSAADYPLESVKSQEEGAITLQYLVLEQGNVGDIKILKSSGFARLDEASVAMVKSRWRFSAARMDSGVSAVIFASKSVSHCMVRLSTM